MGPVNIQVLPLSQADLYFCGLPQKPLKKYIQYKQNQRKLKSMKDPLTQTFLFHADNILMTNTKKKQRKKKQSQSIYSACLFQVPLRKMRIHTVELEDNAYDNYNILCFFSNTILPTFRY